MRLLWSSFYQSILKPKKNLMWYLPNLMKAELFCAEELQHRGKKSPLSDCVAPNPEKEQNFAACLCVGRLVWVCVVLSMCIDCVTPPTEVPQLSPWWETGINNASVTRWVTVSSIILLPLLISSYSQSSAKTKVNKGTESQRTKI